MGLYGRDELVAEILEGRTPVLLITGDSGVGKSALLAASQNEGHARGEVTASPIRLGFRPGALQEALLEQLASVTSSLVADLSVVRRVGEVVVAAARQVARDRGHELALVVGKELLAMVKARLGEDVGQVLADFVTSLSAQHEQTLLARLRAAADPDALATVVSFAGEVEALAQGATIALCLDDADRLADPDFRQLADVIGQLPEHTRLRVGHRSDTPTHRERIRLLRTAGARELSVPGIDESAVAEWMAARGIDVRLAGRVHRITSGYPLYVDDVLASLARGDSLRDIEADENFILNTHDILHGDLDVNVARAVRLLSAYADPPTQERLLAIVGVDEAGWAEMRDRLIRCRMFATDVAGRPWFHELRRRAIWAGLNNDERSAVANRALDDLQHSFEETGDSEALVGMALIASDSPQVRDDPFARAALDASTEEVAVAAAMLELAEGPGDGPHPDVPVVIGDQLLVYAWETFHRHGDLLAALQRLAERNLLVVTSNESASAVVPRFTTLAAMLLAGRAGAELGRMPIPQLASSVFYGVIAPRLGHFDLAGYGLGRPSIAQLSANATKSTPSTRVRPRLPFAVLARGDVAGQPFYTWATYPDPTSSEQARTRLAGMREPFLNDYVDLTDVLAHPLARVPVLRFLIAASRTLDTVLYLTSPRLITDTPLSGQEAVQRRAETLRYARALCTPLERYALELEEPIRIAFACSNEALFSVEVHGGEDGMVELNALPAGQAFLRDPYQRFRLHDELGLPPNERLGLTQWHIGQPSKEDPVVATLADLSKRAASFNRHHPRLDVPLRAEPLQELLINAARRCHDDAKALHAALPFTVASHPPEPKTTLVLVCPDVPEPRWVAGAHAAVLTAVMASADDEEDVRVHVAAPTRRPDFEQVHQAFREAYGFNLGDRDVTGNAANGLLHWTEGNAAAVLAEMLGHRREDIRIKL